MLGINGKYPAGHPTVVLENCEKSAVKHSTEKPYLLTFVILSTMFCPGLYI